MFAKIGVGLIGIICLLIGLIALVAPDRAGAALGIQALTDLGLNSMRADFAAFFLVPALCCAAALFGGRTSWLWPASLLFLLAGCGRVLGIILTGMPEGVVGPLIVEFLFAGMLAFGATRLPRS